MIIDWKVFQSWVLFAQIEEATGKDPYDWLNTNDHFTQWHALQGYPETDSDGEHFRSSRIWYKEYKKSETGNILRPPHQNFWHWLLNEIGGDIPEDRKIFLNLDELTEKVKARNGVENKEFRELTERSIAGIAHFAMQPDSGLTPDDVLDKAVDLLQAYQTSVKLDWVLEILGHIRKIVGSPHLQLEV